MDKELVKSLDASIDILMGHSSSKVGNFIISKTRNGRFEVQGYSKYPSLFGLKNIDHKPELEAVKTRFISAYEKSKIFKYMVDEKNIDYYLQFDYGGGSIILCKEVEGIFECGKL